MRWRLISIVWLLAAGAASAQEDPVGFFRLAGPVYTEIVSLSVDGELTWTNASAGVTGRVQRATDLPASQWVDHVGTIAEDVVQALRVADPETPEGMAFIPEGWFWMGDAFGEGDADEVPVHVVYTRAFHLDRDEVTKAHWDEVAAWAATNGYTFDHAGGGKAADHPVHTVSWHDAAKWCNARSERAGWAPCYTTNGAVWRTGQATNAVCDAAADGARLPTEAEWEKAARGGETGRRFPWRGSDEITHGDADYYSSAVHAYDTSPTRAFHPTWWTGLTPYTAAAGSGAENGYGVRNMAGNVWEWCGDWYDGFYYSASPEADPPGAETGAYRVLRGGSWNNEAVHCRTAFRIYNLPTYAGSLVGFRCARTAP